MINRVKGKVNFIVLAIVFTLCMTGCGKEAIQQNAEETALLGKWCYVHDTSETVAKFSEDGSAEFEGEEYQYTCDGEFINLTDENGTVTKLRYLPEGEGMYVYLQSVYTRQMGADDAGIVGVWLCEDKGWTFEFTSNGTFMEDGVSTGYYTVDEETQTIKLVYETALADTVFYFTLTGNELSIEYPWLMIKR